MEYKQGDKVRIVKNEWHHSFRIGDVVTLRERGNPTEEEPLWWSAERGSENSIIGESDFELYVDSEEGAELPMTTPEHYNQGGVEPKDFINSHNLNFNLGNVVKYVSRAAYKGTQEQDLRKAIDYLYFEIERISNLNK